MKKTSSIVCVVKSVRLINTTFDSPICKIFITLYNENRIERNIVGVIEQLFKSLIRVNKHECNTQFKKIKKNKNTCKIHNCCWTLSQRIRLQVQIQHYVCKENTA